MNKKQVTLAGPIIKRMLKDPEVKMYYQAERARSDIAMAVFSARKRAHLTQVALAKKAGTSQGVIARLESGKDRRIPSMPLLAKVAKACGGFFEFNFTFKKQPSN